MEKWRVAFCSSLSIYAKDIYLYDDMEVVPEAVSTAVGGVANTATAPLIKHLKDNLSYMRICKGHAHYLCMLWSASLIEGDDVQKLHAIKCNVYINI